MTGLPEAEVIRRNLEREVLGKRCKEVTVTSPATVGRHRNRPEFVEALRGQRIEAVARRGTTLLLALDGGATFVIRLGSRATLVRRTASADPGPHAAAVVSFTTGGALHYDDPDADGELFVAGPDGIHDVAPLPAAGLDPLADTFTWHDLERRLRVGDALLRAWLVDPEVVVGLGALYADEVLFAAGLAGDRRSSELSSQEVRRLHRALVEVLHEAVKRGTAPGGPPPAGDPPAGDAQDRSVHGREGQPCPRCRQPIRLGQVHGLASYFCAQCQT